MSIKPGYTRVSEILSQWDDYEGVEKSVLEKKAALGTEVHEAIMGVHEDIYLPFSEEAQGYMDSFLKWKEQATPQLVSIGRLYCDKLKITGELDCLCKIKGSDEWIIADWKTTAVLNEKRCKLQGQFYYYLFQSNNIDMRYAPKFMFIQLKKDGAFPTVKVYDTSKELMNVCMSAYICYKYWNKG